VRGPRLALALAAWLVVSAAPIAAQDDGDCAGARASGYSFGAAMAGGAPINGLSAELPGPDDPCFIDFIHGAEDGYAQNAGGGEEDEP